MKDHLNTELEKITTSKVKLEKKWPVTRSLFKCSTQILKIMSFEKIKLQFASHLKLKESKDKIEQ